MKNHLQKHTHHYLAVLLVAVLAVQVGLYLSSQVSPESDLREYAQAIAIPKVASCGDTITTSIVLTEDLICDPAVTPVALTVAEDNLTLDCAGYSIIGKNRWGVAFEINNRYNVTVKNCNISDFLLGVNINSSRKVTVLGGTFSNIGAHGVSAAGAINTEIRNSSFTDVGNPFSNSGGAIIFHSYTTASIVDNITVLRGNIGVMSVNAGDPNKNAAPSITNSIFSDCAGGIFIGGILPSDPLADPSPARNAYIAGNTIVRCDGAGFGIRLGDAATVARVFSNEIFGSGTDIENFNSLGGILASVFTDNICDTVFGAPDCPIGRLAAGDVITTDRNLWEDPSCLANNTCLTIAGGSLDGNGYTLHGDGTGIGLLFDSNATNARLTDLKVNNFQTAVSVDGSGSSIIKLTASGSENGVSVNGSGNFITQSQFVNNTNDVIFRGSNNTLASSVIMGSSGGDGVTLSGNFNRITGVTISDKRVGIRMSGDNNEVYGTKTEFSGTGLLVEGAATANLLQANTMTFNLGLLQTGIHLTGTTQDTLIRDNVIKNNGDYGVIFGPDTSGNRMESNFLRDHTKADISDEGTGNTGDNNACLTTDGFNDDGASGCDFVLPPGTGTIEAKATEKGAALSGVLVRSFNMASDCVSVHFPNAADVNQNCSESGLILGGEKVDSCTTDTNGECSMVGVPSGNYFVTFEPTLTFDEPVGHAIGRVGEGRVRTAVGAFRKTRDLRFP